MKQKLFFFGIAFAIYTINLNAQNNTICENATPLCFQNNALISTNNINNSGLGQIACLGTTPNPTWNFFQVDDSGVINMQIKQTANSGNTIDIDFVLWGPYSSIESACGNLDFGCPLPQNCPSNTSNSTFYPYGNIMDCSFSASSIENFTIPDGQSGEIYVLLTTNYSNQQGEIKITQSNANATNAGSIDVSLNIDLGPDQNLCNDTGSITLNAYSPVVNTYEWFKDGYFLSSGNNAELTVAETGNYTVLAYNNTCNAVAQDNVEITFIDCNNNGLINVRAFYDVNNNSIFETDETNFSNGYFTYELNADGFVNYVTSSTGNFTIVSDDSANFYDISYYFYNEYQDCYDVITEQFNNVSVINGTEITIDFPVTEQQSCEDIALYLSSNESPRPGFNNVNYLTIKNLGLLPTSGTIEFNLDDNLIYNSASNANPNFTLTPNSTGFVLDFVDLLPGFTYTINISIYCPQSVSIGELVTNTASYVTSSNDIVIGNNVSSITETVIGSYDPNDIIESHGSEIDYNDFILTDQYLYYTIRFQNVGTADAINVRIENTLNQLLDISTLKLLDSSHDVVMTRTNSQLIFDHKNINLETQEIDQEDSKGYVYYKIKPLPGYIVGTQIPNTAEIYFDFNEAVITNTFTTTFVETQLSVEEFSALGFNLYPNPASNEVTIRFNNALRGSFAMTVIDIQGKQVLSTTVNADGLNTFNVSQLESGLYFVKLKNSNAEHIQKLIVK